MPKSEGGAYPESVNQVLLALYPRYLGKFMSKITQAMGGTAPHKHFKNTLKYWYIQLITSKYIYISV